jgi:hypothetical protein
LEGFLKNKTITEGCLILKTFKKEKLEQRLLEKPSMCPTLLFTLKDYHIQPEF